MERFLIIDADIETEAKKTLVEKFDLTILDAQTMTNDLLAWPSWKNFEPWSTLIVLPGNGASIVKKYINNAESSWFWQWPWKTFPHAKRVWIPGKNPQAFVGRINPNIFVGIKTVIVIDDVISSGETIRKLRKKNKSFIPMAEWQAIT